MHDQPIPAGLCRCGCGSRTKLRTRNSPRDGYRRGDPAFYLPGHAVRKSPVDWCVEDRGYVTPCWIWQGSLKDTGYGCVNRGGFKGSTHVWMYERHVGPVPVGLQLDHLCRVRACGNPEHLEPVTNAVNGQRGARAKLTWEQVHQIRASVGTHKAVGERFGISHEQARQIRLGRQWKEPT
jgi:hypothetical protein